MLYDIACRDCEFREERSMSVAETDNLEPCKECGSEDVYIEVNSAPSTILKGRGWFRDGYQKTNAQTVTQKDIEMYERTGKVRTV